MRTSPRLLRSLVAASVAAATLSAASPATAAVSSPTADVQAGARSAPDTRWISAVRSCNRYISTTGADTASGTTPGKAWRTLAKAMRELRSGQTACVRSGTYQEGHLRPARSGTAAAPIAIRRYPGDAKPLIKATGNASLFDFQASGRGLGYWLVDGFDLDKQHHDGAGVRLEGDRAAAGDSTLVSHIAIRNNRIRSSRAGGAILVRNRVTDVLISGNEISDNHRFGYWKNYGTSTQQRVRSDYADAGLPTTQTINGVTYSYGREDAHGISIESDGTFTSALSVERVRVQKNRLLRNGGDGVQCIGATDSAFTPRTSDAADIDLVDNRMEANAEEGADIKSCQWVSIRGSVSPGNPNAGNAAANKMLTSRPTNRARDLQFPGGGGNFGGGDLIVAHYAARHILIENTRLWNACQGIVLGRDEIPVRDVIVRRVLQFSMATRSDPGCAADRNTGSALEINHAVHVDVYHNTFDMPTDSPSAALSVASGLTPPAGASAPYLSDIDVWNNIVRSSWWDNVVLSLGAGGTVWTGEFRSNNNLYHRPGAATPAKGLILSLAPTYQFDAVALPEWRTATGQDKASLESDPQFVADPVANDYFTKASSPARDSGTPIAGYSVPTCPGKSVNLPDRGFRESC
jgi:hypothetical protein